VAKGVTLSVALVVAPPNRLSLDGAPAEVMRQTVGEGLLVGLEARRPV